MVEVWIPVLAALVTGAFVYFWSREKAFAAASGLTARIDELRKLVDSMKSEASTTAQQIRELEGTKAAAETRAEEAARLVADHKRALEEAAGVLKESFKSLASDALRENRDEFLVLADEKLKAATAGATSDIEQRRVAIESLVKPLRDAVEEYRRETAELERRRASELGRVQEQYRDVARTTSDLQRETTKLVNALRSPHVRGRWGQFTLRRIAELAGMVSRCDFYEQEVVEGDRRLKPDLVVRLPNRRVLIVDSKVPLDAYLDAVAAETEPDREAALQRYGRQTREHVTQLASKDYQGQVNETPEFVVLFIPNDAFLGAAAEKDPELLEYAFARNIIIATPATLIALLKVVAHGWREIEFAENAERINRLAQQLAERLATLVRHVEDVGSGLTRAVEAYNGVVGSLESRVLPAARQFRVLGANVRKEIPELMPIDVRPRNVTSALTPEGAQPIFGEEQELLALEAPPASDGGATRTPFEPSTEVPSAGDRPNEQ